MPLETYVIVSLLLLVTTLLKSADKLVFRQVLNALATYVDVSAELTAHEYAVLLATTGSVLPAETLNQT
jgi:hypothetical protein